MKEKLRYPFEGNVLMYASIVGLLISIVLMICSFGNIAEGFYVNVAFASIFLFVLIGIKSQMPFRWILVFFYLPFITLLVYAFHKSNGLQESIEHNIYVGLIFIIFTLRGKWPLYFSLLLLFGVVVSFILIEDQHGFFQAFEDQHRSDLNFIFAALGIIGFTYYAKSTLINNRNILKSNRGQLEQKSIELTQKRDELEKQKEKLEALTVSIDKKVAQRTEDLQNQRKRREEYLQLISSELNKNFELTINAVKKIDGQKLEEPFLRMLHESANSLEWEMKSLKEKVIDSNG